MLTPAPEQELHLVETRGPLPRRSGAPLPPAEAGTVASVTSQRSLSAPRGGDHSPTWPRRLRDPSGRRGAWPARRPPRPRPWPRPPAPALHPVLPPPRPACPTGGPRTSPALPSSRGLGKSPRRGLPPLRAARWAAGLRGGREGGGASSAAVGCPGRRRSCWALALSAVALGAAWIGPRAPPPLG